MDPDKRATFSQMKKILDGFLVESQERPSVNREHNEPQQGRISI